IDAAADAVAASADIERCDVWVAAGIYHVYLTGVVNTIQLRTAVDVYGGFAGDETERDQRDFEANRTYLDGRQTTSSSNRVIHVVTGAGGAHLDGFVIAHGYANSGAPGERGGGMYNFNVTGVTVANCVFVSNYADTRGGAVYNENASIVFDNCVFASNSGGDEGGAVQNRTGAVAEFINGLFQGNQAVRGGAVYVRDSSQATFRRCVLAGNTAADRGGAVYQETACQTNLESCLLAGNHSINGGALQARGGGRARLAHGTVYANEGSTGVLHMRDATALTVVSSILWNAGVQEIFLDGGGPGPLLAVTYSDVDGGWAGAGNTAVNPLLAGTPLSAGTWTSVTHDPDTHTTALLDTSAVWVPGALAGLLVQPRTGEVAHFRIEDNTADRLLVWGDLEPFAGGGDPYTILDLRLRSDSSCIDGADGLAWTETDLWGNPRVDVETVADAFDCSAYGPECVSFADIGALEYQP
ncbi:MAG TPA: hypothetical protein VM285_11515, partial [Polyangia bacterium]|nr:hypothetical protein [Polyangia bacterium]